MESLYIVSVTHGSITETKECTIEHDKPITASDVEAATLLKYPMATYIHAAQLDEHAGLPSLLRNQAL